MNHSRHENCGRAPRETAEPFIRIPPVESLRVERFSGILIKFLSPRSLPFDFAQGREPVERRLRGDIVFGQG
jgi:hypothetical protein